MTRRLTSPYDFLNAYSVRRITAAEAMAALGLDWRGLVAAMTDAGHRMPEALPPPFDERLKAIKDEYPITDHVLVGGLKSHVDDHLTGRDDPTSPNYRQSVRVEDLPEEFFEALRADMDAREVRIARGPVIVSTPGLMGGAPCFRGTRVPRAVVDENLAEGMSVDDLLDTYPTLDRADVLAYVALRILEETSPSVPPDEGNELP